MDNAERLCKCGHGAGAHEVKRSEKAVWKDKCSTEDCPCKRFRWQRQAAAPLTPVPLKEDTEKGQLYTLAQLKARQVLKVPSGLEYLDEAMSGGFVANSAVLLAGKRGSGKSTLMTVVAGAMSLKTPVLYVSGEEDASQFAYRAVRLQLPRDLPNLHIMDCANLDLVWEYASKVKPGFIIIDSLQSLYGKDMNGAFVANKRTANYFTFQLRKLRKTFGSTLVLVGHETKQGEIAGDASLQHEVDVVLQLDPDEITAAKVVNIDKNRFGPTPATFRFLIRDNGIEGVKPLPSLDYKAPEILG